MNVKDNFNKYYSDLLSGLQETDASIKGSTVYKATPPSFPYMYYKQIDGSTALTTLSSTEDGINLGLQIEFYSKKNATNVREIANTARGIMIGFGFSCSYFEPVENTGDTSIYRFMTRFEKLET